MNWLRRFMTIATAVTCGFATTAMPTWHLTIAQTTRHGRSIAETPNTVPAYLRAVRVGEHPGPIAVDVHTRRVFVVQRVDHANCCIALLGRGSVEILDARNGRMLRQVTVGKGAEGIALDARTGHVFVANSDDGTVSVIDA